VNCGKRRKTRSSNGVPTRSRWRLAGACAMWARPSSSTMVTGLTAWAKPYKPLQSAEMMGARAHGPLTQGDFLRRLGIEKRAATLKTNAAAAKAAEIDQAVIRLTEAKQGAMGELFKVISIADPKLGALPGFEA
jgi:SAM-dependent MidA family methyltransferase